MHLILTGKSTTLSISILNGPGHHGLQDVSAQIIDKVHNNEKLAVKEGKWAYRLQTLKPESLNDSDVFYSHNRVTRKR